MEGLRFAHACVGEDPDTTPAWVPSVPPIPPTDQQRLQQQVDQLERLREINETDYQALRATLRFHEHDGVEEEHAGDEGVEEEYEGSLRLPGFHDGFEGEHAGDEGVQEYGYEGFEEEEVEEEPEVEEEEVEHDDEGVEEEPQAEPEYPEFLIPQRPAEPPCPELLRWNTMTREQWEAQQDAEWRRKAAERRLEAAHVRSFFSLP